MENYKGENAKLETCIELITQAIAGGHKILLFSQFNVNAGSYWREIKKAKIDY